MSLWKAYFSFRVYLFSQIVLITLGGFSMIFDIASLVLWRNSDLILLNAPGIYTGIVVIIELNFVQTLQSYHYTRFYFTTVPKTLISPMIE